jgi:hypothetical protein
LAALNAGQIAEELLKQHYGTGILPVSIFLQVRDRRNACPAFSWRFEPVESVDGGFKLRFFAWAGNWFTHSVADAVIQPTGGKRSHRGP